MASPDVLFKGISRRPSREYTRQALLRYQPKRVVTPCVGSFSLAAVAATVIAPGKIWASDVTLYSLAIGSAVAGRDFRVELLDTAGDVGEAIRPYLGGDVLTKAAAVLCGLRAVQFSGAKAKIHLLQKQRELLRRLDIYVPETKAHLQALAGQLSGLQYESRDLWEVLSEYKGDEQCSILLSPPRYTGGYTKMFEGIDTVFDWDNPSIAQFREEQHGELMEYLADAKAQVLMYYAGGHTDPSLEWGSPWNACFADKPSLSSNQALNWIVTNKPTGGNIAINRWALASKPQRYKLFDGQVTAESHVRAMPTTRATADYYRDLFIHKINSAYSVTYALLMLDGAVWGVTGLLTKDYKRGRNDHMIVVFAFTVPHSHPRLHKLTLLTVVSSWFYDDVFGASDWYQSRGRPGTVHTLMKTPYPESKTARGILTLDWRNRLPDGSYELHYSTELQVRSQRETVKLWLQKWGK